MRLIASVCVLGLFMFVLCQEDKKDAREVKAAEDDSEWFKGEEKYLKYWTHSWPNCTVTGEPAWRPCHKCCPLGFICTTDLSWNFPNANYWLPPVFMWKWWCCENEPCPNIHSWPNCTVTGEPAWRPCHKCCPLGFICTTDLSWNFPNTNYWLPPVFMWKWWCCENEPCPNIHCKCIRH